MATCSIKCNQNIATLSNVFLVHAQITQTCGKILETILVLKQDFNKRSDYHVLRKSELDDTSLGDVNLI